MSSFVIEGGHKLSGEIIPQGAKNEALEVICAVLLTPEKVTIHNVPDILDVNNLIQLLRDMRVKVERPEVGTYTFQADDVDLDYLQTEEFLRRSASLRGSVMIIGPLVARFGKALLPKPGGDKIGRRRLDTHFLGIQKLGADFSYDATRQVYRIEGKHLKGTYMLLDEASVTDIWLNAPVSATAYLILGSNGSNPLFADCPLDEVYIGRRLLYQTGSSYGYSPFYRNTSLRTVEITDAETQIYDNEFYGCSNLASLKIGNGVTSIGNWAFSGCSSLDYFSAGYQVDTIGTEAFSDCTGLTKYYSYSIVPPGCGDQALDDINKQECTLYVPDESTDEYKAAPQWKDFFFMEEMEAVLVAEIKLSQTEATLAPNDTVRLTAQILPANATDPTVVWSSSDESIATVDETGLVTALAEGTATITAKSQDGNAEATCTITVETGDPTTGIDAVTAEEVEIEVYNLHGHQVGNTTEDLPAGVYIIKEGNRTYKTVVR